MSPGRGTVARGSASRVWLEFTIMYSTLGINEAIRPLEGPPINGIEMVLTNTLRCSLFDGA